MTFSERDTLVYLAEKVGHGFKFLTLLNELREPDDFEPICPECGHVCGCTALPDAEKSGTKED